MAVATMGPLSWPLNENGGRPPDPSREARVVCVDPIASAYPTLGHAQSRGPSRRVVCPRSGLCRLVRRGDAGRHGAAMRTQQYPGSGSRRATSRPSGRCPSSRPRRKSRFMPHTRVRCCSASRWNGQLASAISSWSPSSGWYPCRARRRARPGGHRRCARLRGPRHAPPRRPGGRRPARRRGGSPRRAHRSCSPRRRRPRAATRPGRSGVRGRTRTTSSSLGR